MRALVHALSRHQQPPLRVEGNKRWTSPVQRERCCLLPTGDGNGEGSGQRGGCAEPAEAWVRGSAWPPQGSGGRSQLYKDQRVGRVEQGGSDGKEDVAGSGDTAWNVEVTAGWWW